jgi:hypothetical protein
MEDRIVGAYVAGTTSGALVTTLALWTLSGFAAPLSAWTRLALLAIGIALVWSIKAGPLAPFVSLPEARRQIPTRVFHGSLVRGAFRFGFELGTGVRTYVPAVAPYILALVLVLGRPTLGAAVLAALGFGMGRAIPLAVHLLARERRLSDRPIARGAERLGALASGIIVTVGALALA